MESDESQTTEINLVLIRMNNKSVEELQALLPQEEITIIKKPETGLLMMTVQDPCNTDFHLGEILVTEAEVEYKGLRGYAVLMGDEPGKTLLAASVKAILQTGHKEVIRKVTEVISRLSKKMAETDEMERRLIARTGVSFETMVKG
jgi:alpha-D-ribose 1-methylphosphonate 5-triphosphate synthase subunit PhnG